MLAAEWERPLWQTLLRMFGVQPLNAMEAVLAVSAMLFAASDCATADNPLANKPITVTTARSQRRSDKETLGGEDKSAHGQIDPLVSAQGGVIPAGNA